MIEPKGNNITVKPQPAEKVLASGIIIPDTITIKNHEWGKVVNGNDLIPTGSTVLYYGKKCFKEDGKDEKLVATNKVFYWV